jgi:hypothetical protein
MLVFREVFRCKPGKANAIIEKFKAMGAIMERRGEPAGRILVDAVSTYWTVVVEFESPDMATFERQMQQSGDDEEARAAMEGYHDLIDSGHREIFRVA